VCAPENRIDIFQARSLAFRREVLQEVIKMLKWAFIFLVIALIAALLGFTGIASAAAGIAKFLFFLFLVICLIFFIIGISIGKKVM
jgi:uncharacterized membrane protein YtjA (UPF0391 family)